MHDIPEKPTWLKRMLGRKGSNRPSVSGAVSGAGPLVEGQKDNAQAQESMMSAAEEFHRLRVEDVMVPRADIVAIESIGHGAYKGFTAVFNV